MKQAQTTKNKLSAIAPDAALKLKTVIRRLQLTHAASLTAQLALRQQDAEYDREIADVLRNSVCDLISDQIDTLEELLKGFNPINSQVEKVQRSKR